MNQALSFLPLLVENTSQHKSTSLLKPVISKQKVFSLQGKVVSIYNVELLTLLGFFGKSIYSRLSLYWQKEGNYYETRNRAELSMQQMKELLTTIGPHSISIHFTVNDCLEVDSNIRDEIFINYLSEKDQPFSIECLYNLFMYSTLIADLKYKSPEHIISSLPEKLYQTTPLEE